VLELGSRWHDVVSLDLRYEGQEYTLTIPIASSPLVGTDQAEEIRTNFDREYERTFGHALDAQVEIVTVRVSMRLPLPRRSSTLGGDSRATHALVKKGHESYSFSRQEWLPFALVDRSALSPGMSIAGPAIVLEETATTYLDADFGAKVLETGALMLSEQGEV
jgi:N-methylhydantoinase A